MTTARFRLALLGLAVGVAAVTMTGIGVRATYGAQTTADEPQYLLSASSLFEDGDLDISDELAEERYRPFHEADLPQQTRELEDGRRLSPHNPLLPLLLAVPTGLGGWVGAKATMALLAGALAAATAWTARHRLGVSGPVALALTALFALSPPLSIYATQIYPELPAALAVVGGMAALLGHRDGRGRGILTASVVALPWLGIKYLPVAAVLAVIGLLRLRGSERAKLAGWLAGAGVVYVAAHLWIYGALTPYATGDHFVGGQVDVVGTDVDLLGRATRLVGLWVDQGFGIAAWQPAYLTVIVAAGWWLSRRAREEAAPLLSVALAGVGVASFVALTMHGWWFPGRQLVAVMPAFVLLVAAWADRSRVRVEVVAGLGLVGVAAFGVLLAEGWAGALTWVVDFGSTANPLYRLWTSTFPDYMASGVGVWVRHGVWAAVLVGLMALGWVQGRRESETVPATEQMETRRLERT